MDRAYESRARAGMGFEKSSQALLKKVEHGPSPDGPDGLDLSKLLDYFITKIMPH